MDTSEIDSRLDILEKLTSGEITTGEATAELDKLRQKFLISDEEYYWRQMQEISSLTLRAIRLERIVLDWMKESKDIQIGSQSCQ